MTLALTAKARKTDIESSHEAAASVNVNTNALLLLRQFAKKSMTSEEAALSALPTVIPGYWKRASDLNAAGLIEHRGASAGKPMFRPNTSGRKAAVWIITPLGRAILQAAKSKGN